MNASFDLGLHKLRARYRAGTLSCSAVIEEVLRRIATAGDDKVWISRASDSDLRARAAQLDAELARDPSLLDRQPLFGVPFAVKDNIDVAGSGRVPAGFNNIVGLKPTPGLLSTAGVVPACRSLDCVSVFALSCADA